MVRVQGAGEGRRGDERGSRDPVMFSLCRAVRP